MTLWIQIYVIGSEKRAHKLTLAVRSLYIAGHVDLLFTQRSMLPYLTHTKFCSEAMNVNSYNSRKLVGQARYTKDTNLHANTTILVHTKPTDYLAYKYTHVHVHTT